MLRESDATLIIAEVMLSDLPVCVRLKKKTIIDRGDDIWYGNGL